MELVPARIDVLNMQRVNIAVIAASGTYTPAGLLFAIVEVIGGGSGSGDGGYARGIYSSSVLGASQAVVIGAGGGSDSQGGTTSFGSLVPATGGDSSNGGDRVEFWVRSLALHITGGSTFFGGGGSVYGRGSSSQGAGFQGLSSSQNFSAVDASPTLREPWALALAATELEMMHGDPSSHWHLIGSEIRVQ